MSAKGRDWEGRGIPMPRRGIAQGEALSRAVTPESRQDVKVPLNIVRRPLDLPPMVNIKAGEIPSDGPREAQA